MPKLSTPLFRLARKLCRFRGAGPFCVSLGLVLVWGPAAAPVERVRASPFSRVFLFFGVGRTEESSQEGGTAYSMDGVESKTATFDPTPGVISASSRIWRGSVGRPLRETASSCEKIPKDNGDRQDVK